jgi:ferredoxin-NADP reductase
MPTVTQETVVERVATLSPEVRELVLRRPDSPLSYQPGQWVSLHLPVGDRPPLVRAYTMARPEEPSGELTLCFDRVEDGLGSGYLFERHPGDPIVLGGVLGNFVLPEPQETDLLMVARYTGIVPFRCMLLSLRERPLSRRIRLVYSARGLQDLIYHPEFVELAATEPIFDYYPVLQEPGSGWTGAVGDELALLEQHARDWMPFTPMVCGVRAFTRPVREFFHGLGFERRAVRFENYD